MEFRGPLSWYAREDSNLWPLAPELAPYAPISWQQGPQTKDIVLRAIRTLVADKEVQFTRLSDASSFNPEGFFHEAITNAKDLPVKTDRRIGVMNPELNLVTHLKRAIGIVELNDAMLGV